MILATDLAFTVKYPNHPEERLWVASVTSGLPPGMAAEYVGTTPVGALTWLYSNVPALLEEANKQAELPFESDAPAATD
jgi:hypothetical protein